MIGTYSVKSREDDWGKLPGRRDDQRRWRKPWSVFISTCKSLSTSGISYSVTATKADGVTIVQVTADGTPSYKLQRANKPSIRVPPPVTMLHCTKALLEARRDKSAEDMEHWTEMIRLTPGAENRIVNVYVTNESCDKQGAWADCDYEKAGHGIAPCDAKPLDKRHGWTQGKREDLLRQCRDALANGKSTPRHRVIARLVIAALPTTGQPPEGEGNAQIIDRSSHADLHESTRRRGLSVRTGSHSLPPTARVLGSAGG